MVSSQIAFSPGHDDLIHDISYDFYGKRLASCSSDLKIKIFDFDEEKSTWILNDDWKAHDSSVLKVKWAHPEFGNVVISSSFDRSIKVWEEQLSELKGSGKRWIERARLLDSHGSIQDIEISPHYLGLKLATCSSEGICRIYEVMDITNLSHWTLMEEFEIYPTQREVDGQFCLSWCPSKFLPQMLAIGCGKDFTAKIFRYDDHQRKWTSIEQLPGHSNFILDVSWAPNLGRSYELIATACRDGHVRIFKILSDGKQSSLVNKSLKSMKVDLIADFSDHEAEVWRVSWNVTGTILSSSGDDGKVRLWKMDFNDSWKCISIIPNSLNKSVS